MKQKRPSNLSQHAFIKSSLLIIGLSASFGLTACQTMPTTTTPIIDANQLQPKRLETFAINGKIGIVNKALKQSGSAFYAWTQEQERFAIELQGALGIGMTRIEYNGSTASLTNAQVGTITADDPESLLLRATGWQAPISQLPYWISGSPAPSDSSQLVDGFNRLTHATNGNWHAEFSYTKEATLPSKIKAINTDGSKVTLIVNHDGE